jgi:aspartyl aminopeptidase
VDIRLGEEEGDPIFTITDLLPHLAREQMQKKVSEAVPGEELNILAGSQPFRDNKAKDKVKLKLLNILHEEYGMVEQDFSGAELEMVPAFRARDLGFDRSMIGAYGHDDKSCAYTALRAVLELAAEGEAPAKTIIGLLTDKEETGSAGNTGAQSRLFENFAAYLLSKNAEPYSEIALRRTLSRSAMLSADVNSAFDPNFDSVYDKKTASYFGKGLVLSKYTGSGGKIGGSEANAEFCGKVQGILNRNKVQWQYGDLGKVDKGGGGTIAKYVANLGVEVLDCGVPVLSMHSPFEVISKIDLYTTYRGYAAFLRDA